jgi:hypothetical protein
VPAACGARRDGLGIYAGPHPDTTERVFRKLGAHALASHAGACLALRALPGPAAFPLAGPGWLPALAVDGKAARGAAGADGRIPYLLAAACHGTGAVLAERLIGPKTNEVPELGPLLLELNDYYPLSGHVITADAGHTVKAHATLICERLLAHYVFTVKLNTPALCAELDDLDWGSAPRLTTEERGHGRWERRAVQVLDVPEHIRKRFPHARQAALDGTLIRVPDTPANRAAFGSVGTADGSSPFPQVRALPLSNVSTRALLGMTHGPAGGGTGKAAGEQKLLDEAMEAYPGLFAKDRLWLADRNFPGTARLARLIARTHVLIRLKSDIPLWRVSPILADGSYLADLSGDGLTIRVRVIEYFADVEGQDVPEMFCLVTDLTDIQRHPAPQLAALYKWRWDGSETALREAEASLDGAGPGTGPMLRSGSPSLVRQELAAWAAATEMTRGVARDAALAAAPARKGRWAGQPVRPREISHTGARRAVTAAIRAGHACYQALTSEIARCRTIVDRNRHRARKSKSPSSFGHATAKDTATRIAPAVITMANTPA